MTPTSDDQMDAVVDRLQRLFDAHLVAVFNVAHRVLWNRADAEDVVQNSFIKAATRLDQLRDENRARPWLLQIAYREAIAVLRKRRETPVDPAQMPDVASAKPGPEEMLMASDLATAVAAALKRLEPDERMAVVLRDIEELPMREVADVIGIGLSAAKMRVSRGRASLRFMLNRELTDAM